MIPPSGQGAPVAKIDRYSNKKPDYELKKTGYIYMYTYERFYNSYVNKDLNDIDWLYVDESVINNGKTSKLSNWEDNSKILCKIGMTTTSVEKRLSEWRNVCKHDILNLSPERIGNLQSCYVNKTKKIKNDGSKKSIKKLADIFSALSIKNNKNSSKEDVISNKTNQMIPLTNFPFKSYRNGGFYSNGQGNSTVYEIESTIHKYLWKRHGKAKVYCYGCDPNGKKYHTEWFNIPIDDLSHVMKVIDTLCYNNSL
ncbi:hypothetical protein TPHA_0G02020 [Tetrapisispora phaffii CBS 4417]|uniref:Uncharacterized protein n=1 Tax=Tetrapisispora phaffii (strain ATCC 24235 / CBS 4417 / NBRC 1672 / NRRL Y-8282 / UCD 70-5) TaxID=1071381 RepID=G8BVW0_TETPH|nr:hypothetical protein TPHA_0G02020 [Tetrapisispora phaffii CBS 4417]CCE64038.1 hypothetical protein TPHA_0G02020 [Tetrapisispora phaffii CBS 4417]